MAIIFEMGAATVHTALGYTLIGTTTGTDAVATNFNDSVRLVRTAHEQGANTQTFFVFVKLSVRSLNVSAHQIELAARAFRPSFDELSDDAQSVLLKRAKEWFQAWRPQLGLV